MAQRSIGELVRPCRSLSIIGMCKNAGKTTVLNHILEEFRDNGDTLALTSIGRDGEGTDLVTGTRKPGIYVREGTLLATAEGLLRHCDIIREILDTTGISTPMGEVVVLRALSDGAVQLAGPSMVAQLIGLSQILSSLGADRVIVDGAVGRKSLCTRSLAEGTVLCTGASLARDIDAVLEETRHTCRLLTLPALEDEPLRRRLLVRDEGAALLLGREELSIPGGTSLPDVLRGHGDNATTHILLGGALTDSALDNLLRSGLNLRRLTLIARDASRLLVGATGVQRLEQAGAALRVLEQVNLVAVAVNPFSAYGVHFDPQELQQRMQALIPVPVINVEEAVQ